MSSRKNQPAALTAAKQTSATSTRQDGIAAYLDDSATLGSPLWGFRQYCHTIATLRSSTKSVEEAAIRAVSRAYKLAEVATHDTGQRADYSHLDQQFTTFSDKYVTALVEANEHPELLEV